MGDIGAWGHGKDRAIRAWRVMEAWVMGAYGGMGRTGPATPGHGEPAMMAVGPLRCPPLAQLSSRPTWACINRVHLLDKGSKPPPISTQQHTLPCSITHHDHAGLIIRVPWQGGQGRLNASWQGYTMARSSPRGCRTGANWGACANWGAGTNWGICANWGARAKWGWRAGAN